MFFSSSSGNPKRGGRLQLERNRNWKWVGFSCGFRFRIWNIFISNGRSACDRKVQYVNIFIPNGRSACDKKAHYVNIFI